MKLLRFSKRGIYFTLLSMLSSVATVLPLTFDFTRTISNAVLSNGNYIERDQPTEWLGKNVNDSFILGIDNLTTHPNQAGTNKYYFY